MNVVEVHQVEVHQMEASDDAGAYYGQFMTDLEVNDARRALEIAMWGCHRWRIEIRFKTLKREGADGFGLENTFCANENASQAMHLLMPFAHNVWQVFKSGVLEKLSAGCRKVTQSMWGKKICEALHYYDYSGTGADSPHPHLWESLADPVDDGAKFVVKLDHVRQPKVCRRVCGAFEATKRK